MTKYYLVKTNGYNMAVVVDDETLLSVEDKEDRAVFYLTETEEFPDIKQANEVEDFLRVLDEDADWHSWETMPEKEFNDMIEAMDPDHAEVVGFYKVYEDEEVPSEFGMEDGHFKRVPTSEFTKELKYYRSELDMNMREIAEELEIPYRTWQDWEAGRREPAQWTINLLLEKLEHMIEDQEEKRNYIDSLDGKKWGELSYREQKELSKNINAIDASTGLNMTDDGECTIDLEYLLSVPGRVENGEIVIDDDAVIYNPCK